MLISVSCPCGQKWSFKSSMAGRTFSCRKCGKAVSIGSSSSHPGATAADSAQQDFTQTPVARDLQRKPQSSSADAGRSTTVVRPAGSDKHSTRAATLVKTPQPADPTAPGSPVVAIEQFKTQQKKSVSRGGNRVVVAAATCIGLAVAAAVFLVVQNESQRALKSSEEIWNQANDLLNAENVSAARKLFKQYVASWQAPNRERAEALLAQIELATSDDVVKQRLASLDDAQFQQCIQKTTLPDNDVTHPVLIRVLAASISRNADAATKQREDIKARKAADEALAAARREQELREKEAAEQAKREAEKKIAGGASAVRRLLGLNQGERKTLATRIAAIETALNVADLSSKTVFQQQVGRVDACIEMTGLLALSLGATPEEVEQISNRQVLADITADNVYQQLAGHLNIYIDMMELAAAKAGAPTEKCESVRRALRLEDGLARTVLQQVSSRIGGVSSIAALLAEALGADAAQLSVIALRVSTNELSADTVFQQMVARQSGIVFVLATAATAQGAPDSTVESVEADARRDDLLTDTAQQQLAARLERTFQATTLLAKAIVEK